AIRTLWIVLQEMDLIWIPVYKSWRLNERHYGALQGLNKAETAKKYGEEQVHVSRRSMNIRPPELDKKDPRYEITNPRYQNLKKDAFPLTENMADTEERLLIYWHKNIVPAIQSGQKVIMASHGTTIRSLVQYLDQLSDEEIVDLNIPTGRPLVYELDEHLKP